MNALAAVISQVESAGFPYALRFEYQLFATPDRKGMMPLLDAIKAANHCDLVTARMIAYTSFGLFQIMGFNLFDWLGWKQSVATFLFDTEQQLATFTEFCHRNGIDPATFDFTDEGALVAFARAYNGPGAIPAYVAKMKAAFAQINSATS